MVIKISMLSTYMVYFLQTIKKNQMSAVQPMKDSKTIDKMFTANVKVVTVVPRHMWSIERNNRNHLRVPG